MTLKEVEEIPREYLTPIEVAAVLGMHPQDVRNHVRMSLAKKQRAYDFPVLISGARIKFPKAAFLNYMRGQG